MKRAVGVVVNEWVRVQSGSGLMVGFGGVGDRGKGEELGRERCDAVTGSCRKFTDVVVRTRGATNLLPLKRYNVTSVDE